jgi:hypothetical protein
LYEQTFNVNASLSVTSSSIDFYSKTPKIDKKPVRKNPGAEVILTTYDWINFKKTITCVKELTGKTELECKHLLVDVPITLLKGLSKRKAEETKRLFAAHGIPYIKIYLQTNKGNRNVLPASSVIGPLSNPSKVKTEITAEETVEGHQRFDVIITSINLEDMAQVNGAIICTQKVTKKSNKECIEHVMKGPPTILRCISKKKG